MQGIYSILIEMKVERGFLPLQVAIKYYQKWECDVSCQMEDSIYYKCLNGNGSVEFLNGNSYSGGFKNGFMHGNGLYRWKNGLLYDGEISNNTIAGQGKLRWPDGSHYSGSVVQGRRHGYGEYYCSIDGSNYKGEWSQGVKEGKGVLSFANGAVFQGEFKAGLRHGHGKMKYQSGNEYEGGWKEDKKEGSGVMNWHTTMERYEGEWRQDTPWGLGSYYWFQGKEGRAIKTIFKGEWRQGRREGFGTFFYNNGCRLEGTFASNLKDGVCFLVDEFGQGHLETFRGDKSILKKEQISIKVDKKHFRLPEIQKGGKEGGTGSSVLQVNEPQENSYWRFLDFDCGLVDESICNVLLRENSQLRQWHRALMGNQGKEAFGGFSLEGLWRLVRDMRLTDESITLARLNREFFKGSRARFQVQFGSKSKLQTLKDNTALLTPHNYYSIEWEAFFDDARKLPTWQGEAELIDSSRVSLNRELNIHSSQHTVLFRHFVTYILHLALLHHRQAVLTTPTLTFRKCLEDLFCSIKQAVSPVGSFKTQKNCSEIMTNVSHNQSRLHIPEQYSAINRTLFSALSSGRPQLLNTKDQTVTVKQVYCLLGQCGLLREPAQKMLFLEKIERNMNVKGSLLRKDNKTCYPQLEKVLLRSPHFTHILNYEMIEAELDDILYVFLNRKIGNTQSKEQFLKKYRETIKSMVSTVQEHAPKGINLQFNYKRYSAKDRQKDEFLRKMVEERQRGLQEERKVQQVMREQKERAKMAREDIDVKDQDPSEASQQYYD